MVGLEEVEFSKGENCYILNVWTSNQKLFAAQFLKIWLICTIFFHNDYFQPDFQKRPRFYEYQLTGLNLS